MYLARLTQLPAEPNWPRLSAMPRRTTLINEWLKSGLELYDNRGYPSDYLYLTCPFKGCKSSVLDLRLHVREVHCK